jgi:hypothetical protein
MQKQTNKQKHLQKTKTKTKKSPKPPTPEMLHYFQTKRFHIEAKERNFTMINGIQEGIPSLMCKINNRKSKLILP